MMAPRPDKPLVADRCTTQVLIVAADPASDGDVLLGPASTFDVVLEALVNRADVTVDEALAALILYTCHGKPGEVGPGAGRSDRRF
jgi:hypothetical protein